MPPREERRAHVACEHRVIVGDLHLLGRCPDRAPGIVDQDVDLTGLGGEPVDAGRVPEVRLDELVGE